MEVRAISILGFNPESIAREAGMEKGDVIVEYRGIGDLTMDRLTALTTGTTYNGIGTRVIYLRSGSKHSVMLPQGSLGISAMDTTIRDPSNLLLGSDVGNVLQKIQKVYFLLGVLGLFAMTFALAKSEVGQALLDVLFATIYCFIYFGLRYRKEWAITLVLILAAFNCISIFFRLMHPAQDIKTLVAKGIVLLLLLFFAYNIVFFRKPEVRALFGDKETLVI